MEITKDGLCWPSVEAYIQRRIEALHTDLETADAGLVPKLQGQLAELRLLLRASEPLELLPTGSLDI